MYRNSVVLGVCTPTHTVARSLLINPAPVTIHLYRAMLTVFQEAVRAVQEGGGGNTLHDLVQGVMARAQGRCSRGREWAALYAFFSQGPGHSGGSGGVMGAQGQVVLTVNELTSAPQQSGTVL